MTYTDRTTAHPLTGRNLVQALSAALAALALLLTGLTPTAASTQPVSVFVVAHQDDELLTFGSAIRQHAETGRVVVVLATDGSATRARLKVEARLGRAVTPAEITVHRDTEFTWTCRALGAHECVTAPDRAVDGTLTDGQADDLMSWVAASWPGARVKSHTWLGWHNDHVNLGEALARAHAAGTIYHHAPLEGQ